MKAFRCDRCGEYFNINDLPPYIPNIVPTHNWGYSLDLCPTCIAGFAIWLHTEFYFDEQVKRGNGFPSAVQECSKCKHWIYKKDTGCVCDMGKSWRPTTTICDMWETD